MPYLYKICVEYKWFASIFVLMITALVSRIPLGTFNDPSWLDVAGHFILVATGAPLLMLLVIRFGFLPELTLAVHYITATSLLGIGLEVLWEIFEFSIDALFGITWQVNNTDTMIDIILGVIGAAVGSALFVRLYGTKLLGN